jgi:NAD+ synthetase
MIQERFNYEKLFNEMVDFTADYITKNGLKSANLGISGGIDSTVVAALLYEVAKKIHRENSDYIFGNFGYSLPTSTTYEGEYLVSTFVGNAFADVFETHNIESITSKMIIEMQPSITDVFRRGNIKSRYRMVFLYDKAKENSGFVVGTDNYTEKLLGFSTIGGDALADYMPLQYLWKTEVYGLANYLKDKYIKEENWSTVNAINESIKLVPQDGLGISISDMDQIGAKNYFDVDEILYEFEDSFLSYDAFVFSENYSKLCEKFRKDVVDDVIRRRVDNFKLNLPIEFKPKM